MFLLADVNLWVFALTLPVPCLLQALRNDTLLRGVPSSGTYDTQNWQNDNVKPCCLRYHSGSIPDLAALVPVPDGLFMTCKVVPNVLHPWTSGECQTQNLAVHVHSHLLSPCSGESGVPCLVSVRALTADAFGTLRRVAHHPANHVKPHLKSPQTHKAPPTFVVLPSISSHGLPRLLLALVKKKPRCHDHLL